MPSKNCGTCGARLLTYENPDRTLCPRQNKHHLYVTGNTLGDKKESKKTPKVG